MLRECLNGLKYSFVKSGQNRLLTMVIAINRIKQATERAKPQIPVKDSHPGSTHASSKFLATRRMSRKDLAETNPLLAKEVAQAVREKIGFYYFWECIYVTCLSFRSLNLNALRHIRDIICQDLEAPL